MILKSQYPMATESEKYAKIISNLLIDKLKPKSQITLYECVFNSHVAVNKVSRDIDIAKHADQYIMISILTNFDIVK